MRGTGESPPRGHCKKSRIKESNSGDYALSYYRGVDKNEAGDLPTAPATYIHLPVTTMRRT